jgi:nucleotide-binding universal stress UspA family protein
MKPLNRLLVGTDFSPAGRLAVTRAGQLASQYGADLHVIHATPDWSLFSRWTSARREHYDEIIRHAQRALRDEINWIASTFGIQAQGDAQPGKASEVICRTIASYQPDILVVGSRGEHEPRISPSALGGTTLKLVLHAHCPLLVVRGWDLGVYKVSIAAVHEANDVSKRVVFWGTALVEGGDCHVVHAYEAPYIERMRLCGIDKAEVENCVRITETAAREGIDQLLAAVPGRARVHTHLIHGDPLGVLVTEIARYGPQLVVIGSQEVERDHSPREPFGAFGLRMAYHTPVDTLVVP